MLSLDQFKKQLACGQLRGAKRVHLCDQLQSLPRELFSLADTLEELNLSSNCLSSLPQDLGRFTQLKILFLSDNQFEELPRVLKDCPKLEMIGFKANKITYWPEHALPETTRWLILTDNHITEIPASIAELTELKKLMLAGNQIKKIPPQMIACQGLELMRIAANQLDHFPEVLLQLKKLSWLAFAGNPFCQFQTQKQQLPSIQLDDFSQQQLLGEGASGKIYSTHNHSKQVYGFDQGQALAIKVFKKHVTSDGYPEDELQANLQAGQHENLIAPLAFCQKSVTNAAAALIMNKLDSSYAVLGQPPSFASCTRDSYPEPLALTEEKALKLLRQISHCMAHLHQQQLCHGDLYAHNILHHEGNILLSDFGAASSYRGLSDGQKKALEHIECRAFAHLIDDILQHSINLGKDLSLSLEKIRDCIQEGQPTSFSTINQALNLPLKPAL